MISTTKATRAGAVIFTGDKERVALFYEALTGLGVRARDEIVTVLGSDDFELVVHALPGEPVVRTPRAEREAYVRSFFPVKSLSEARERTAALGGRLSRQPKSGKVAASAHAKRSIRMEIPFNSEKMRPDSWPVPTGTKLPIHD